jgi:hypothetical protein
MACAAAGMAASGRWRKAYKDARWATEQQYRGFIRTGAQIHKSPSHLYEIPITILALPSRKNIRQVANDSLEQGSRVFAPDAIKQSCIARPDDSERFRPLTDRSMQMMDIIMLALGLAFFALSVGYTIACDRL